MHPFSSRSSQFFDASWVTAFRHSHLHQSFFDCESQLFYRTSPGTVDLYFRAGLNHEWQRG